MRITGRFLSGSISVDHLIFNTAKRDSSTNTLATNLQKRQVCKKEKMTGILYSAKNIPQYSVYEFEFPWEKKAYDPTDIYTKTNTYWYDPKEFNRLLYLYQTITLPILTELKAKTK